MGGDVRPGGGRRSVERTAPGVLAVLRDAAAPLALADLAADLVEREAGPAAGAPDYDAIQRRYVML